MPWMMLASFFLWITMFWGYLSNNLAMILDAPPYYRHIELYLHNISRGVYPLWDPNWQNGAPWEFFLRRIGNYNPLFFLILVPFKLGISFIVSYLWFMAGYYFLGMVGFYFLLKRIVVDERAAFLGFLLLLFSSLSSTLFYSYIQLIIVPYFWFFYFLVAFTQEPKKFHLLGTAFCLMVIMTTYIPFYFITVVSTFLILYLFCYFSSLRDILMRYGQFIRGNKIFTTFCVLLVVLSLYPGYRLYKETASGELVMPTRHQDASSAHMFAVSERNVIGGDVVGQLFFDRLFVNQERMDLGGTVYIPLFAYIILLLGLATAINRKMIFLSLWAFLILIIALTTTTPLYGFLNKYVFFLKYIRQIYFFFWIQVLPVFIVILSEQCRQLLAFKGEGKTKKIVAVAYVLVAHGLFLGFLVSRGHVLWTSYVVILLSLVVTGFYVFSQSLRSINKLFHAKYILMVFIVLVCAHPLQAYYYLSKNEVRNPNPQKDVVSDLSFRYQMPATQEDAASKNVVYYSTRWIYFLFETMDRGMFNKYIRNKFVVYDNARTVENDEQALRSLEGVWAVQKNTAVISEPSLDEQKPIDQTASKALVITQDSPQFQVKDFNANQIRITTDFDRRKFLVYNDSYSSDWHAFVNGEPVHLYRANVAFKGIWLPAGKNSVLFRYHSLGRFAAEFFYLGLFVFTFLYLIVSGIRSQERTG